MASITIKNVPDDLMERLRRKAEDARRSLNQQILRLLEQALTTAEPRDNGSLRAEIETQVHAWDALAGKWGTDESAEDEIARIYAARTVGRKVEL